MWCRIVVYDLLNLCGVVMCCLTLRVVCVGLCCSGCMCLCW